MSKSSETEKMKKVKEILENNNALSHAMTLLQWDLETEAPAMAVDRVSKTLGYFAGESYSMIINEDFKNLVYSINTDELDEIDRKIIEELKKESFEKLEKIPKEEHTKYSELRVVSTRKWEEAKNKDDYNIFKSYLSDMIEFNKKFIKYRGYKDNPYNTLLDDYEPEITVEELDKFFENIKNELSPFIKKIISKEKSDKCFLILKNRKNYQCIS